MTHFKHCFLTLLIVMSLPIGASLNDPEPQLEPLAEHSDTTQNIVNALAERHYVPTILNDALSSRIFDTYINDLDPSKSYFLKGDIDEFEAYRDQMDNSLQKGDLSSAFHIFNRYHKRVINRFENLITLLENDLQSFDFEKTELLEIDRDNAPWATTQEELDDLWRKRLKNAVLSLKLTDKEPEKIQELLVKRYKNRLVRTKQTNSEDVYQLYMNAFTKTYDPHTSYFSPRTSENFNINMSLSLEGIGAVLQLEDEYIKIVSLVPAGPAAKTGLLKPNDKIVGVGQGRTGELVDVIGWRLDEVVELIRGKKDTVVRLDIVSATAGDSTPAKIIEITRNKVELEEQSAHSEIIEIEQFGHARKIGVIEIPTFYVDFQALQAGDKDFKSTTRDVKKLITDLKQQQVDGIVIDLRNNGGGSLQEAKTLTGLFIDQGPTVLIRSKSDRVDILADRDMSVEYDGPLVVLVNRLSASASEIFAGAIQDYERGIIIGSQTFGKGTVQSLLPLNRGQLKLTQAKFYRISGESTQERGIIPDIIYPSSYDPDSIGESTLDHPLPWDKIPPTNFRKRHALQHFVPELQSLHVQRVAKNPEFNYLKEAFAYRKTQSDEEFINLNEAERIAEKEERETFWLHLENTKREANGLEALASLDELDVDESTIASINLDDSSGEAAIVPDQSEAGDPPVPGSEMAAVSAHTTTPIGEGVVKSATPPTSLIGSAESPASETHSDKVEEPDPYLIESGNVILDLITLEERTAADRRRQTDG